jgi:hypothetical protein
LMGKRNNFVSVKKFIKIISYFKLQKKRQKLANRKKNTRHISVLLDGKNFVK